ncbi:MAG: FAD-dependent oxidoreductase, partial [Halobacteriovoraceae bacterium]|nr:FAD-dependent oxidoreductase [Halobacteriovoraceae bacterium]
MSKFTVKVFLLLFLVFLFFIFKTYNLEQYLTLSYLKENQLMFAGFYRENSVFTIAIYMGVYIVVTALSLPGALILTLAGGALFGFTTGVLIVSFSSTIGATLAFLAARFFFRDWVQSKFKKKLAVIEEGVIKEGAFYLFTLRLIPVFPFFLINLVMGLTPIKTSTYFFVSQIGMLAGTMVYVNAGKQLSDIDTLKGIFSFDLLLSFALLGILPLFAKKMIDWIKSKRVYKGFKKPAKYDYNMLVIGAGSAGLVTAYICSAVKAKVALIERHKMGGDCLNTGCVPSKALVKSAKVIWQSKNSAKYGIDKMDVRFDFAKIMDRVKTVIEKIEPHDSVERYTDLGVDCIKGDAKFISPWEVQVGDRRLVAKNITIATGASPFVPPIKNIDQVDYLTSDTLWNLRELPGRLVVLGGGPIGLEMAQSFNRF